MNTNELQNIQKESTEQGLPEQKKVLSAADKEYILSREKAKDPETLRNWAGKKKGEYFVAVLTARHIFDGGGERTVACKVQDNLAGEVIVSKTIKIEA